MIAETKPLFWVAVTIGSYAASVAIYRRHDHWWTSPLLLTWAFCFVLALILRAAYGDYIKDTHWLLTMLGPATVAFALPVYEQRQLIRSCWPALVLGVAVGSTIAFGTSWFLASALGLPADLRLCLLPRSVTTPFALAFAHNVGGIPELTATCVVVTGVLGALLGEFLLNRLPLRSEVARGSLMGMGAHAVGTAKARQMGHIEGAVAALMMILAGVVSVLVSPVLSAYVK